MSKRMAFVLCAALIGGNLWGVVLPTDVHAQVPDVSLREIVSLQLSLGALSFFAYLCIVGLLRLLRGSEGTLAQPVGPMSDDADAGRAGVSGKSPEHQSRENEVGR